MDVEDETDWTFTFGEPIRDDIREIISRIHAVYVHDVARLSWLRDAPEFTPSHHWPTRRHVHLGMRVLEAGIEWAEAMLATQIVGDAQWDRSRLWSQEFDRRNDVLMATPELCRRPLLRRPLMTTCHGDHWGSVRECLRRGSGDRQAGTDRRHRRCGG